MPTIATVNAAWTPVPTDFTDAHARRFDTAMFLGDGSNNGVRGGIVRHGDNSLAVSVNGADQVTVQAGAFVIPAATGLGVYRGALSAATAATGLAARNATNPRIDLIVVEATSSGAVVKTIDGNPGASPSVPALPAQHIELARVTVPAVGPGAVIVDSSWRAYATGLGGTLYVETDARLPGSGNQKRQRAVALDTDDEYIWNGTDWGIQKASGGVAAVGGVTSSGTTAYIRSSVAIVNVSVTMTAAQVSGASLFVLNTGYRPPAGVVVFDTLTDTTGDVPVRAYTADTGVVRIETAVASGRTLRGKLVIPLP